MISPWAAPPPAWLWLSRRPPPSPSLPTTRRRIPRRRRGRPPGRTGTSASWPSGLRGITPRGPSLGDPWTAQAYCRTGRAGSVVGGGRGTEKQRRAGKQLAVHSLSARSDRRFKDTRSIISRDREVRDAERVCIRAMRIVVYNVIYSLLL